ncbi:MAG: hypothetical protein LIP23_09935, partial [Planctomycetes bacterium]|nr:hypothetical protein [Planctomycetota bacterium]
DDTQVLHFNNVDVPRFEALVARMEQNAGERFSSLQIGGYRVRYYNRRASMFSPLAPAFCLMPHQQGGNKGLLLMASHPQALVSLIREATATRETLATQPDFAKVMSGLGNNFSFLYYHDSRGSYPRVYNFLLPLAAMWASSTHYPVDTGLLPTAATIAPAMFGCAIGMKQLPDGISIQAYSPLGFHGLTVNLADRMVVSNPLVIGYLYSMIDEWMAAIPDI